MIVCLSGVNTPLGPCHTGRHCQLSFVCWHCQPTLSVVILVADNVSWQCWHLWQCRLTVLAPLTLSANKMSSAQQCNYLCDIWADNNVGVCGIALTAHWG